MLGVPGSIQSVERAAAILQLIGDQPDGIGLSEIAETLELAKATTYGLLWTLCSVGFVQQLQADSRYRLGAAILELGQLRLDPNELRSHAMNWSDSLASRSGEAVRVAVLQRQSARIVHHVFRPDDSTQQLDTGTELPAHACALGKVLLAWAPAAGSRRRAELDGYTAHTVTSARLLARDLVGVRQQGWAGDIEELADGKAAIAAPIRGTGARVVASIGITGALDRVCDTRGQPRPHLVAQVLDAARAVSRDLVTARR